MTKNKVIAGLIALACVANMLGVNSMFTVQKLKSYRDNTSGISTGMMKARAYSQGCHSIPETQSTISEFYNNAKYSVSISEVDAEKRWTEDASTYNVYEIKITHEVPTEDGGKESVEDLTEYRVGLVGINVERRLTSHKAGAKVANGPSTIKVGEESFEVKDHDKCTVISDSAYVDGGIYLKSVDLAGILYIGSNAFVGCQYITVIDIPETVINIGSEVFKSSGVKTVNFNNNITKIPDNIFADTPLGKVTFKNQDIICDIGAGAFSNTAITEYPLADSKQLVYVEANAFSGCEQITQLSLNNNIVRLGAGAFKNCTALKTLVTGENCNLIEESAFENCVSLTSITLNDNLQYLGAGAFRGCISLVDGPVMPDNLSFSASGIGVPELEELEQSYKDKTKDVYGITVVNDGTSSCTGIFENCTALKTVSLPKSADTVPEAYCRGCTSLTTVALDKNVINIYDGAFSGCENLQDIRLSDVSGYIGSSAFNGCKALKTMFSENIAIIRDSAFMNCESLKEFTVNTIHCADHAFDGCIGLTDVSLTCNAYGTYIFANCTSLKSAYLSLSGAPSTPDGIFYNCTSLTSLKDTDLSTIEIVGVDTFNNCQSLQSLAMPKVIIVAENGFNNCINLEKICAGAITIQDYGDNSFQNCAKLKQDINSKVSTIGTSAFANSGIKSITIDGTVGNTLVIKDSAFSNCNNLEYCHITAGDGIEYEVGSSILLNCANITDLVYSGTEIPMGMAENCVRLQSVKLDKAEDLRDRAFFGCTALKEIKGIKAFKSIGAEAFKNCTALNNTYADISTVYSGNSQYTGCSSLKQASVYSLTDEMFSDCSTLSKVTLSKDISVVPASAFMNCISLTDINLDNVKSFSENSFNNSGLHNLKLTSANNIASGAFSNCANLSSVSLEVDEIGQSAFENCGVLAKAEISTNMIGDSAFNNCKSLYLLTLPNINGYILRDIGENAFYNTMLTDVLVSDTVTYIGGMALGFRESDGSEVESEFTIYGTKGSEAQSYANVNELIFKDKSLYDESVITKKKNKPGDVNADGVISVVDAVLLQRYLLGEDVAGIYGPNMDVNGDNKVDVFDMCIERSLIISSIQQEENTEENL